MRGTRSTCKPFNKHVLRSLPSPASGCCSSFHPHNNPRRLLLMSPLPQKEGDISNKRWVEEGGKDMPLGVSHMLIPEGSTHPTPPTELPARCCSPLAQVPLLRGSQRDPSAQDIVRTAWSVTRDNAPRGGQHYSSLADEHKHKCTGKGSDSRHKQSKGRGSWPVPPH